METNCRDLYNVYIHVKDSQVKSKNWNMLENLKGKLKKKLIAICYLLCFIIIIIIFWWNFYFLLRDKTTTIGARSVQQTASRWLVTQTSHSSFFFAILCNISFYKQIVFVKGIK